MRKLILAIVVLALAACSTPASKHEAFNAITTEMNQAVDAKLKAAQDEAVANALLPPVRIDMPKSKPPVEERFGMTFNNVPAQQFFMSIVTGTPYSMLVHPDVSGTISANLKDVTLFEALDAIREIYGYDYKVEGTRIFVKPIGLQTRLFKVNYLTGNRKGTSDIRVTSGSVGDSVTGPSTSGSGSATQPIAPTGAGTASTTLNSSKISTTSNNDFWAELKTSLETIIGSGKEGRRVVISPQSGMVLVHASWDELNNISAYLKAMQLSVDRQVVLEAKILEVQLNDSFQTGVNWASFASFTGNLTNRVSGGFLTPGTSLASSAESNTLATTVGNTAISAVTSLSITTPPTAPASLFGMAFQTNNFAALLAFLETQGTVHVLSSPRIATLNNQKAVLKVGTDEFFVTNVSTTPGTISSTGTTAPTANITVQPFFSGVALDVTPQIDEDGNIILHIHPSVSNVTADSKSVNLGSSVGVFSLPLAKSAVSETDSIVRAQNGRIVAIGGLMRQGMTSDNSQLPGVGSIPGVGALFRNTAQSVQKRELVILLKPTVVDNDSNWTQDLLDSQRRIQSLAPRDPPAPKGMN